MSDNIAMPTRPELPTAPTVPATEDVARGTLFALVAIPVGMVVSAAIWKMGFVASISSFLVAGGAVWLYAKGAGAAPRKGLPAVIAVILVGVVLAFLAVVAIDLSDFWTSEGGAASGQSRVSFVLDNVWRPELISSYGSDLTFYVLFAALGTFGTLRRLFAARRQA